MIFLGVRMITTDLDLDYLKKMYNNFKDTNEENIKIHVVVKFLEMLGYDSSGFYYEHSMYHKDGRADIAVKIDAV
jgi:integrase/recombinase XerD